MQPAAASSTSPRLTTLAPPGRPRSVRRRWRRLALGAGAASLLAFASITWLLRDPMPHFVERRSSLAGVEAGAPIVDGDYVLQVVRVTAASGLAVDLTVRRGPSAGGRLPLVLVLGGHRTGKDAVRLLGRTEGAIVAAMSYPYTGDKKPDPLTFVRDIPKIRQAFLDTPPAVMLSLDYLRSLPDVDTTRVEAVGVSLGAPFVTIAGALDDRIHRVWTIHGSGGSYAPLEMNMRRTISFAPLRWAAAALANVIANGPQLAPERWVGRIAPRPFVMINADADERIPRRHVERLYRAAGDPKELIWTHGGHVRSDSATIAPLVRIVWDRVAATAN
jgi:hypothetical protein